jgi:hypothetical protein
MFSAITVRRLSDDHLIAFGPDNGQYDPGYDTVTMAKQREPDYDVVKTEWIVQHPDTSTSRQQIRQSLKQAKTLPELLTILDQLL